MNTLKTILAVLLIGNSIVAQDQLPFTQSQVDSIVHTINTGTVVSVKRLSQKLCKPFSTEEEKVRAIFYWITDNISYDYVRSKSKKGYRLHIRKGESEDQALERIKYRYARRTILKRKGICEDYSWLFHLLCKKAGLSSVVVHGYAWHTGKTIPTTTRKLYSNHAWNAIFLNGEWKLLDATWASGHVDPKTGIFTKEYDAFYYLTPPDSLIKNHFPSDEDWQLLENTITTKQFIQFTKE